MVESNIKRKTDWGESKEKKLVAIRDKKKNKRPQNKRKLYLRAQNCFSFF